MHFLKIILQMSSLNFVGVQLYTYVFNQGRRAMTFKGGSNGDQAWPCPPKRPKMASQSIYFSK